MSPLFGPMKWMEKWIPVWTERAAVGLAWTETAEPTKDQIGEGGWEYLP